MATTCSTGFREVMVVEPAHASSQKKTSSAAMEPADAADPEPVQLLALSDDVLTFILSACTASSLEALAGTCKALSTACESDEPWSAALWREIGLPRNCLDGQSSRDFQRRVAVASPIELKIVPLLSDGGLDGQAEHMVGHQPPGTAVPCVVPDAAQQFWVSSCFAGTPDDYRCFCSDVSPTGGAAVNILVAGSIAGALSQDDTRARQGERQLRAFIVTCLARVAEPLWGWHADGFGGLRHAALEQLQQALIVAWGTPGARHLLTHGLSSREKGMLQNFVRHFEERPVTGLALVSIALPNGAAADANGLPPSRHPLLVDVSSLSSGRYWDLLRHKQCAFDYRARADALRAAGLDATEAEAAATAAEHTARAVLREARKAERALRQLDEDDFGTAALEAALPWVAQASSTGSSASSTVTVSSSSSSSAAGAGDADESSGHGHTTRGGRSSAAAAAAIDTKAGGTDGGGAAANGGGAAAAAAHLAALTLAAPGTLALLTHVRVRRGVHCSCPVVAGVLFGCRGPLHARSLYAAHVLAFDDVLSAADLPRSTAEARGGLLPAVHCVHELDEGVVVELTPEDEGCHTELFPVAWFRFTMSVDEAKRRQDEQPGWLEKGELLCELVRPRCSGMLIAKLLGAENRMREMADDHAEPNIDVEHIGACGHVVDANGGGPLDAEWWPQRFTLSSVPPAPAVELR